MYGRLFTVWEENDRSKQRIISKFLFYFFLQWNFYKEREQGLSMKGVQQFLNIERIVEKNTFIALMNSSYLTSNDLNHPYSNWKCFTNNQVTGMNVKRMNFYESWKECMSKFPREIRYMRTFQCLVHTFPLSYLFSSSFFNFSSFW